MSALGAWLPATIEQRLDRMESYAAIQQLVSRYARALDARDMDTVVSLFHPDVQVGAESRGREALKAWMSTLMSQMRTSVHLVANHVIEFSDADHASGVVYCRDELERPDRGEWSVGTIQYWDDYERDRWRMVLQSAPPPSLVPRRLAHASIAGRRCQRFR